MYDSPTFDELAAVPFGVLCGLVHEHGEPAWRDRYDHPWERAWAVLRTTGQALRAAARGDRPAEERAAPPPWLTTAVGQRVSEMSAGWAMTGGYGEFRTWERLGLVASPSDDEDVLAMIGSLTDRWGELDRAGLLRGDPELRDRLWRVFEIEGGGEVSLANVDKYSRADATWRVTFLDLVADGTLDRGRVLSSCLDALQRDFSAYRAQWFSALYRDLRPTPAERRAHQGRYRALLRSGVTSTVGLAARGLRAVSAAGSLDDDEYAALAPGLLARTKGAALDVLRVLDDVARRRPDLHPALAAMVATACEHPHVDVQRAAVAALARLGADPLAHVDALAPSLRRELGAAEGPVAAPAPVGLPVPTPAPVTDADLLDRTAALLEDARDPLEVELVLAGLAALTDPEVLGPLRKRAERMVRNGPGGWRDEGWLRGHLARLVLGGDQTPPPLRGARPRFLARRLRHVADVVAGRRPPGVLLATPDSDGGFLDPERFVHRLAGIAVAPSDEDLVAALLRLGADDRAVALARVTGDDTVARVVRHALGAPPPPHRTGSGARSIVTGAPALWAAAGRAWHRGTDDPFLLAAGLASAGQGRAVRASVEVVEKPVRWSDGETVHHGFQIRFGVRVEHAADRDDPAQPMLATAGQRYEEDRDEWVGWMLATSPHDIEPALTELVLPVLHTTSTGSGEVLHDVTWIVAGLAAHPGPLGPLGRTTLAAALTARRHDHRVLAVDVVAGFAASGRLTAADLAGAMASLQVAATPGRWAGALANLAQAHPGPFVVDLLSALLPALPGDLRGGHALVELLLEESVRTGRRVTDPHLRAWLGALPGRSRGATAARTLAAL